MVTHEGQAHNEQGIGLSLFSSVLATIFTFKPQQIFVSTIFLAIISYVLGIILEVAIPRVGIVGRWLNPHKFNSKVCLLRGNE
jgi:hypothetical protein